MKSLVKVAARKPWLPLLGIAVGGVVLWNATNRHVPYFRDYSVNLITRTVCDPWGCGRAAEQRLDREARYTRDGMTRRDLLANLVGDAGSSFDTPPSTLLKQLR